MHSPRFVKNGYQIFFNFINKPIFTKNIYGNKTYRGSNRTWVKGVDFQISDTKGKHLGHLTIGKGKVTWFRGKEQTGVEVKWQDFINMMESKR